MPVYEYLCDECEAFFEVFFKSFGNLSNAICPKCSSDLHSCSQCTWFDTGSPLECSQPIPSRVSPKDASNTCTYYEARVTVERETSSKSMSKRNTGGARQAFDDLFK